MRSIAEAQSYVSISTEGRFTFMSFVTPGFSVFSLPPCEPRHSRKMLNFREAPFALVSQGHINTAVACALTLDGFTMLLHKAIDLLEKCTASPCYMHHTIIKACRREYDVSLLRCPETMNTSSYVYSSSSSPSYTAASHVSQTWES